MKKNYKKEIYTTREEWLKNRGIGGSDAAAILGKSPWLSKEKVKKRLLEPNSYEEKKNSRMVEGTLKEPLIRQMFVLNTGYKVTEPPKNKYWLFRRKDEPMLTCTPDGLYDDYDGMYGLEIKDVALYKREAMDNWESGIIPDQYYIQILHYMVVLNDIVGVTLLPHLMYFVKNEDINKWVYEHSEFRKYIILREDVKEDLEYLEKQELDFIKSLKK